MLQLKVRYVLATIAFSGSSSFKTSLHKFRRVVTHVFFLHCALKLWSFGVTHFEADHTIVKLNAEKCLSK